MPSRHITGAQWEATARRVNGLLLVELEPADGSDASHAINWIDDAGLSFERAGSMIDLCQRAAEHLRCLTSFDRVMIYQVLDDDSGVVIAEDSADGVAKFVNHRFPASDIPQQARALYLRNRVRVIPDVFYQPQSIRPVAHADLDLRDVALRSVSLTCCPFPGPL